MSYETGPAETPDEVTALFDTDALVARRVAIHDELGTVAGQIWDLQQRHLALIAANIEVNRQLITRGIDVGALAMELAGRLPDNAATEDVA